MAFPDTADDSKLVNDQIQQEVATYTSSSSFPEKRRRKRPRGNRRSDIEGESRIKKMKKHRECLSDDEENHIEEKFSAKKYGGLDQDHSEKFRDTPDKEPRKSSPKKKRNRHKILDNELYVVPSAQNLPPKRNRSHQNVHSQVTKTVQDKAKVIPSDTRNLRVISSPEPSPFKSPPKVLEITRDNSTPKSGDAQSAQEARLQSILKACSRNKTKNAALDETMALDHQSDGSPSPQINTPVDIKTEQESLNLSCRDILKVYIGKDGRCPCPVDGCLKSYTRKDSLSGHMRTFHGSQILRDNGNQTYSVVSAASNKTITSEQPDRALESNAIQRLRGSGCSVKPAMISSASQPTSLELNLCGNPVATSHGAVEGINSHDDDGQGKVAKHEKKIKKKDEKTAAPKLKSPAENRSTPHRNDRDSSASPIIDQTDYSPQLPRSINPALASIGLEAQYSPAMEDWEIIPGTVTNAKCNVNSGVSYEVAYSANYIRANPAVTEFANTSFATRTVSSGCSIAFPLETFVRVCYVVSGKLQVRVDGTVFSIGRGGMWRVIGLSHCAVDNRSYEDAIIHVTSITLDRGRCV